MEPLKNSFRDKFKYGNFMYVLAGCIVEKLGGADEPYASLLDKYIFQPLEMNSTTTIAALLRAPCEEMSKKKTDQSVGASKIKRRRQCDDLSKRDISNFERLSRMYYVNDLSEEPHAININVYRSVINDNNG